MKGRLSGSLPPLLAKVNGAVQVGYGCKQGEEEWVGLKVWSEG